MLLGYAALKPNLRTAVTPVKAGMMGGTVQMALLDNNRAR
jgi:hypothetical protein